MFYDNPTTETPDMRCSEPGHHIAVAIVASRGPSLELLS